MTEIILGIVGFLLAGALLGAGIVAGRLSRKGELKDWLADNGCYLCQERYKYRNPLTGEVE